MSIKEKAAKIAARTRTVKEGSASATKTKESLAASSADISSPAQSVIAKEAEKPAELAMPEVVEVIPTPAQTVKTPEPVKIDAPRAEQTPSLPVAAKAATVAAPLPKPAAASRFGALANLANKAAQSPAPSVERTAPPSTQRPIAAPSPKPMGQMAQIAVSASRFGSLKGVIPDGPGRDRDSDGHEIPQKRQEAIEAAFPKADGRSVTKSVLASIPAGSSFTEEEWIQAGQDNSMVVFEVQTKERPQLKSITREVAATVFGLEMYGYLLNRSLLTEKSFYASKPESTPVHSIIVNKDPASPNSGIGSPNVWFVTRAEEQIALMPWINGTILRQWNPATDEIRNQFSQPTNGKRVFESKKKASHVDEILRERNTAVARPSGG